MIEQEKSPDTVAAPGSQEKRLCRRLNPNTKLASMIRLFIERGDRGLNCFESVRDGHDYVLRSTVSDLTHRYGVTFDRRHERVPGHNDSVVDCVRYWLNENGLRRARELIGEVRPYVEVENAAKALYGPAWSIRTDAPSAGSITHKGGQC